MNSRGNADPQSFDMDDFLTSLNSKANKQNKPVQANIFVPKKDPNPSQEPIRKEIFINDQDPDEVFESQKAGNLAEYKGRSGKHRYRIVDECEFCQLIEGTKPFLYEDDFCVAFYDTAKIKEQDHILICSKDHIKNIHFVGKDNISILNHLQKAGEALLKRLRPNEEYKFGYHQAPDIEHLHLHCIVLPITDKYLRDDLYGSKLVSTEEAIVKIMRGEIHPGNIPEKLKKADYQDKSLEPSDADSVEEYKEQKGKHKYRIVAGCKFCEIIEKPKSFLHEDDLCVAFHDKSKIKAKEHILVCLKDHIKNVHFVEKSNIPILIHLQKVGEALLKRIKPNEEYRFGYHQNPNIEHLHLHCIVLPITSKYIRDVLYGSKLVSTEKVIQQIMNGEIHPGNMPEKLKQGKHK